MSNEEKPTLAAPTEIPADLKAWLQPVEDPELFLSIVDLGLIYEVTQPSENSAHVKMTLTSPGCPAGDYLVDQIKSRLKQIPTITEVDVEIVWEPKWDPKEMASEECKEKLGIW